jgi:deoxyribonuclease V
LRLPNRLHAWDVTPAQARAIQTRLADKVIRDDDFENIRYVAGADIGFEDNNRTTRAAVAVLELPDLNEVEAAVVRQPTRFPYVPGLLSFREVPAVLDALEGLRRQPDLILCDGQGYAHPRRFGLACHLGILADLPTIGVGKTRLIGSYTEPADVRGAWEPLIDGDETIGAVLRSRAGTRPIFVSLGHRISLATAIAYVMRCTGRYRLPETTRRAHRLASGA